MTKYIFVGIFSIAAIICCSFISFDGNTDSNTVSITKDEESGINWISMQELNELAQRKDWDKEKRKVFIDVYTDWCGWCKKMDKTTFQDPAVVDYLNENYYAVKFDAETKETITFGSKEYEWVPGGRNGINELSKAFGVRGFPAYVVLNDNLSKIQMLSGYQKTSELMPILVYFEEEHFKTTPWDKFKAGFDLSEYK